MKWVASKKKNWNIYFIDLEKINYESYGNFKKENDNFYFKTLERVYIYIYIENYILNFII
jgi:hypothetical protein